MIDTFEMSKRLRNAGLNESQAEALVGVLWDARKADLLRLATKDDLARLNTELRGKIVQLETKLTLRVGGMIALATGVLLAVKFFE